MSGIPLIDGVTSQLFANRQVPERAVIGVGLLGGNVPLLQVGQQVKLTILQANTANTLIDLNGTRLLVGAHPGLKPGATLTVRVASLTPQLVLEVEGGTREGGKPAAAGTQGQSAAGRLIIDLQASGAQTEALAGASGGAGAAARVAQASGSPAAGGMLNQALAVEAEVVNLLRAHVADRVPVDQTLTAVQQALSRLGNSDNMPSLPGLRTLLARLVPEQGAPTEDQLTTLVRDGGLHYESKLAATAEADPQQLSKVAEKDVKGLMLRLGQELEGTPHSARTQALQGAFTHHLDHIEVQQAINLLAQLHDGPYHLQVPIHTAQGLTTANIALHPDREGQGGREGKPQSHDVYFQMDLEGLGETRIDAHISDRSLRVVFYLENPESARLVRSELSAFRQTLQGMGYQEVLLDAKPLAQMPEEKRPRFAELAAGVPATVHLVDTRA